jgi:hypothetical protein
MSTSTSIVFFAPAFVTEHTAKVLAVQGRVMKDDSRVAPVAGDAERRHARIQAADVALTERSSRLSFRQADPRA